MAQQWSYRPLSWVLPPSAAAVVRERVPSATAADSTPERRARIVIRRGESTQPIGRVFVSWNAPDGDVTVDRIGWDSDLNGSEALVVQAVEQMAAAPAR